MIALRGTIRHKTSQRSPTSSPTPTSKPSSSSSDYDPKKARPSEWVWTGYWAFGKLPPPETFDLSIGQHKKKRPPSGVRPFVYKFFEIKDASDVKVPSLMYATDADADADEQQEDGGRDEKDDLDKKKSTSTSTADENNVTHKTVEVTSTNKEAENKQNNQKVKSNGEALNVKTLGEVQDKEKVDSNETVSTEKDVSSKSTNTSENVNVSQEELNGDVQMEDVSNGTKVDEDKSTSTKENDKSSTTNDTRKCVGSDADADKNKNEKPKSVKENELNGKEEKKAASDKIVDDESLKNNENDVIKSSNDSLLNNEKENATAMGITFASVSEGETFTDAGLTTHRKICPIGGCWKGYFENVSKRKDRLSSRVQETFFLFFNSTPPADARMGFLDGDENHSNSKDDSGVLPSGYIHVRGSGTNQFGTFEILGGYNAETGILSCQRIYISTTDGDAEGGEKNTTAIDDKEKAKHAGGTKKTVRKSYFTRKRPIASARTTKYGAYDDIYDTGTGRSASGRKLSEAGTGIGRSNSGRKRQRAISEVSQMASLSASDADGKSQLSDIAMNTPLSSLQSNLSVTPPPSSLKVKAPAPDTHVQINSNSTGPSTSILKRPSPSKSASHTHRKPRSSPVPTTRSSPSSTSSSNQISIPKAGNVLDARWRAAHFMYFQRQVENIDSSSPSYPNSSNNPTTTNYLVYEGEMHYGKNLREGRGVCLYNNGTIYEGEWRKNKEHGNGTLLTGDRKRLIYVGEWERGKMHGKGTYYYHMYASSKDEKNVENGGVYSGDFKENARHGVGTYILPGGHVYSGEWRENVPCGKGVFCWSDDSKYDGMWKDGKRNGWGKLSSSDGFQYDGMWVDNAMEGRGSAIYPNGQQYDGMWVNGKRDGRGTIIFGNGAVYKGRFKEDYMEGQGTLKMDRNVSVPQARKMAKTVVDTSLKENETVVEESKEEVVSDDWMIPIEFQSDIGRIHEKAGFTTGGE